MKRRFKKWVKPLIGAGGLLITNVTRSWMSTLDYQAVLYERTADPAHPEFQGPCIFLFWHEYIPFLFYLRGHCNIAMLLSQHQDAEWLSQAARYMGFSTVRGSSNRGGTQALRELLRTADAMNLTITPDGPRGPRRQLAAGCIYLSSRLQIPLVAIGLGYDRPWRIRRAWDRFAVPRPHSRARAVVSPLIQIPAEIDRDQIEGYRQDVETLLNCMTDEAEHWAESGARYSIRVPVCRMGRQRRATQPLQMRAA